MTERTQGDCPPADVVALLWTSLVDMMGSATTATLLRRALKLSRASTDALRDFDVVREGFSYRYLLPPAWSGQSDEGQAGVTALLRELQPVLVELTGAVVLRRLRAVPQLAPYFPGEVS